MADTVCEIIWIHELLPDFGVECSGPIPIHSDSLSSIKLAANLVYHTRTKQVGMDCHFIRDEIIKGLITTHHVSSESQLADIMTKALGRREFEDLLVKLGVFYLHTPP